jgi:hypothetical protein
MADERINVEWIATQQAILSAFEKMNRKLDDQDKKLEKIGSTSKKTANLAAGSFAALEKELRDNEKALKGLVMGTRAFDAQKRKVDALRKSLAGAKQQLTGVSSAASGIGAAAAGGVATVARMAAGMVGLHATISMVVAELEKAEKLKIQNAGVERSLEQVIADIAPNLGAGAVGQARDFIRQGAVDTGTTQQGYANLIGNAISAGAKNLEEAGKVAAASLRLSAGQSDKATSYAEAALDITSLAGTDNFEGALGQISQTLSQVRATDPAQFAAAIGGALAAATAERQNIDAMTTEQALERAAVFSQVTKDQSGAVTATALRQYTSDLDKFVPQRRMRLQDDSEATVSRELIAEFRATRSVEGRERLMQQNEGLRRQFIDGLRESESKIAKVELVSGSKRAMDWLAQAEGRITSINQAQGEYAAMATQVDLATGALRAANVGAAQREFIATEGTRGAEGQALEIFNRTLERIDLPGIDRGRELYEKRKVQAEIASGGDTFRAVYRGLESATTAKGLFEQDIDAQGRAELLAALEEIKALQREAAAIRARDAQAGAGGVGAPAAGEPAKIVVQAPAPQGRPQEAPLPATTIAD